MREALRSYRQMVYLDDLTDAEFVLFTRPGGRGAGRHLSRLRDLRGDAGRNRHGRHGGRHDHRGRTERRRTQHAHIFPYNYLVAQGVLPAGLDHDQQKAFYNCFAGKVNDTYDTMSQFFNAILADTTDMSQLRQLQGQCANDLFEWVITEVDVIESVN